MKQNIDNDLENSINILLIIAVVIGIYSYKYISKINYYLSMLLLWTIAVVIVIFIYLMLFGLTHVSIKSGRFIFNRATYKIKKRKEEERFIQNEKIEIENLLLETLATDERSLTNETEKLRNKMNICRCYKELAHFIPQFKERLAKARERLEELQKNKISDNLEERNLKLKEENEELKRENEHRKIEQEDEKKAIAYEFERKECNVFFKENLTEKEIQALTENGYYPVSEYDLTEKKYINVLVRPVLKHSPTHIFLVWSTKKILNKIGVESIYEHLSADADITFKFKGKVYALEIETGTLLGKAKQIKEKLAYLNKKYPNRWMFIVSNKNLLPKYRKLGFSTSRSNASKNLAKLLKNS
jgi:hypothetical protein